MIASGKNPEGIGVEIKNVLSGKPTKAYYLALLVASADGNPFKGVVLVRVDIIGIIDIFRILFLPAKKDLFSF